jgi:HK97 gp10 family phage protein
MGGADMSTKLRIEGLKEVQTALRALPNSTAKGIMRRILKKRGEPIAQSARDKVNVDEGDLQSSIVVSTKLSKTQKKKHRKPDKNDVEVYIGPGPDPAAHLQEFGSRIHGAHPFMRPAWDANKTGVLEGIREDLWTEINKTVARAAKRAAKAK